MRGLTTNGFTEAYACAIISGGSKGHPGPEFRTMMTDHLTIENETTGTQANAFFRAETNPDALLPFYLFRPCE
jgi:hypothetical protein